MANGRQASRKLIVALVVIILAFAVVGYGMVQIAGPGKSEENLANIVNRALDVIKWMGLGYVVGNVAQKFSGIFGNNGG